MVLLEAYCAGSVRAGRSARVRSIDTPTSREPRIAPGLLIESLIQGISNSSNSSSAKRWESVFDFVADGGVAAINGQLQIDHDRLFDTALPINEPDDALDLEAAQKDGI